MKIVGTMVINGRTGKSAGMKSLKFAEDFEVFSGRSV